MGTALLVVGLLLAQASSPTVGVTLSSGRPGAEPYANTVVARVTSALANERVAGLLGVAETKKQLAEVGYPDPKRCAGGRKCLRDLALFLGPAAVLVGVDVARVGDELVVHLEAVTANSSAPLQVSDLTVRLKAYAEGLIAPLAVFARTLQEKLPLAPAVEPQQKPEPTPEPVKDRPIAEAPPVPREPTRLVPEPTPTPAEPLAVRPRVEKTSGVRGAKVAGAVTGAAALVAGAVAVTFAGLGANDQSRWESSRYTIGNMTGTSLSAAQANGLVAQGNTRFSVALGTGIGAGVLATAAIVLFTR